MTVSVDTIAGNARADLRIGDVTNFTNTMALDIVNEAEREIIVNVPTANATRGSFTLAAGVEQTLPTGGIQLIRIDRNMGVAPGTTNGNSVRMSTVLELNKRNPDWATATASATVERIMFDPDFPDGFQCYPPQPVSGFGFVYGAYSIFPTAIATSGANINLADKYRIAITLYLKAQWALKKEDGNATQEYVAFMNSFYANLGVQKKVSIGSNRG